MNRVTVQLKKQTDQSYLIEIQPELLESRAADLINEKFYGRRVVIVSDSRVAKLYGIALKDALESQGVDIAGLLVFPEGEKSKTRQVKEQLEDSMFEAGLGRDSALIALGGGVVGDLAGYVAATYNRGIPLIQVPTTLLSMVDSSVGGKTGVDVPWGKNLIGAFHQPALVLIDPHCLATLDRKQFVSGMAEVVKHGIIRDRELFDIIESEPAALDPSNEYLMSDVIRRNCEIKAAVVSEDEREGNLRQILNFGHTLGHAVERLSNFEWYHGEAVAVGMVAEAMVSQRLGLLSDIEVSRIKKLLAALELPVSIESLKLKSADILSAAVLDKKSRSGRPRYALPDAIGSMARDDGGGYGLEADDEIVRESLLAIGAR